MLEQRQLQTNAFSDAADWRALEDQLGSPEEATARSASVFASSLTHITSGAQLRDFIAQFQVGPLATQEVPTILRAYHFARQNQAREIIELDRSLVDCFPNEALANASEKVGRNQLRRMRALKTERVVTRYWDAVHAKQARGWHTVVFGVVLAVYSIPLRQGLNHYSTQTISGFLEAGAASLKLRLPEISAIEQSLADETPLLVERALAAHGGNELRCV
jgi:urease accessory protein UreF